MSTSSETVPTDTEEVFREERPSSEKCSRKADTVPQMGSPEVHPSTPVSENGNPPVSQHGSMAVSGHGKPPVSEHGQKPVSQHGLPPVSEHGPDSGLFTMGATGVDSTLVPDRDTPALTSTGFGGARPKPNNPFGWTPGTNSHQVLLQGQDRQQPPGALSSLLEWDPSVDLLDPRARLHDYRSSAPIGTPAALRLTEEHRLLQDNYDTQREEMRAQRATHDHAVARYEKELSDQRLAHEREMLKRRKEFDDLQARFYDSMLTATQRAAGLQEKLEAKDADQQRLLALAASKATPPPVIPRQDRPVRPTTAEATGSYEGKSPSGRSSARASEVEQTKLEVAALRRRLDEALQTIERIDTRHGNRGDVNGMNRASDSSPPRSVAAVEPTRRPVRRRRGLSARQVLENAPSDVNDSDSDDLEQPIISSPHIRGGDGRPPPLSRNRPSVLARPAPSLPYPPVAGVPGPAAGAPPRAAGLPPPGAGYPPPGAGNLPLPPTYWTGHAMPPRPAMPARPSVPTWVPPVQQPGQNVQPGEVPSHLWPRSTPVNPLALIAKFNPEAGMTWREWFAVFKRKAYHYGWDDHQQLDALVDLLDGSARTVYYYHQDANLQQLVRALEEKYNSMSDLRTAYHRFRSRKLQKNEKFETYAGDLRALGKEAHPGTAEHTLEQILAHQFLEGIKGDPELYKECCMTRRMTLDDVRATAEAHRAYVETRDPTPAAPANVPRGATANVARDSGGKGGKKGKGKGKGDGQKKSKDGKDKPNYECHYCHIKGHSYRECKKRKREDPNWKPSRGGRSGGDRDSNRDRDDRSRRSPDRRRDDRPRDDSRERRRHDSPRRHRDDDRDSGSRGGGRGSRDEPQRNRDNDRDRDGGRERGRDGDRRRGQANVARYRSLSPTWENF